MLMQKTRILQESWESRHSENHQKNNENEPQIRRIPFDLGEHTPGSWPSWRHGALDPQHPPQQGPKGIVTWTSGWDRGGLCGSTKRRAESRTSEGSCENDYYHFCNYCIYVTILVTYFCVIFQMFGTTSARFERLFSAYVCVFRLPQLKTGVCSIASVQEIAL